MGNEFLDDFNEQKVYPGKLAGKHYKIQLAEEKIEWAQKIMLVLAFFVFIKLCMIIYANDFSYAWFSIMIQCIIISIYLAASYFTIKKPTITIGLVIIFYLGIQGLLSYYHGPNYWHSGITFKVALFSFLIFGFIYSIKVKNMRKELEEEYKNYLLNEKK